MTDTWNLGWMHLCLGAILLWQIIRTDHSATTWSCLLTMYDEGRFERGDKRWHERLIRLSRRYVVLDFLSVIGLFCIFINI